MSPSPTNSGFTRLAIGLAPEGAGIVRLGGWRGWRIDAYERVAAASPDSDGHGALDALEAWLAGHVPVRSLPWGWPSTARVVLSDRLVRYARVPWAGPSLTPAEETALVAVCFEERYGAMDGWRIRVEDDAWGRTRLAVAVPVAFVERLEAMLRAHGFRCEGVGTRFVASWNRWRTQVATAGNADTLFAVVEDGMPEGGTLVVGAPDAAGGWRSVRRLTLAGEAADPFRLLTREALLLGLSDSWAAWIDAPTQDDHAPPDGRLHRVAEHGNLPFEVAMAVQGIGA